MSCVLMEWHKAWRQSLIGVLCVLLATPALHSWQGNSVQVNLQIIVLGSSNEAERLLQDIKRGADFAALAKQKSTAASAASGGYMGRLDPANLRVELRDALQGVAPDQVTGIIKFSEGYAILKVLPLSEGASNQVSRPNLS